MNAEKLILLIGSISGTSESPVTRCRLYRRNYEVRWPEKWMNQWDSRQLQSISIWKNLAVKVRRKRKKVLQGKVKLINRLTFSFSDHLHVHKMTQCKNLRKYHLLAAIPTTQTALQIACSSLDVDIISFDPGRKWHFRLKRKQYNMAVERGLFFELTYSPAILDATARRNLIQTAHMYHSCGKSKNIIISSGGSHPFHIRGPYDIINLGLIFGLSEEQAKNAITHACRTLLSHGEGRRFGKAVAFIAQDDTSENDHIVKTATSLGDEGDHDGEFQSAHKKFRH